MQTLIVHEHAALFLQTGCVNEETEVISLGTEQVPDLPLGHCEFQWLLRNVLKDFPGTLPGFFQSLLQSTANQAEFSWGGDLHGEDKAADPCQHAGIGAWFAGPMAETMQAFPAGGRSKSRQWCVVSLSPAEIKGGGRLAECWILELGCWWWQDAPVVVVLTWTDGHILEPLDLGNLNCVPGSPRAGLSLAQEEDEAVEKVQLWEDLGLCPCKALMIWDCKTQRLRCLLFW